MIILLILGIILLFVPLIIWFCRSFTIVHTNWRPGYWFKLFFRLSWILMPLGILLIVLSPLL